MLIYFIGSLDGATEKFMVQVPGCPEIRSDDVGKKDLKSYKITKPVVLAIHQEDDDDDMFMRNNEPVGEETSGEAIIEIENNDRSDLQ
ncbi:Hypothetical predicted protein, partial [Mytilus galloprovincialis]